MRKLGVAAAALLLTVALSGVSSATVRKSTHIKLTSVTGGTTYTFSGSITSVGKCLPNRIVTLHHGSTDAPSTATTDDSGNFSFVEQAEFVNANTDGYTATVSRKKVGKTICGARTSAKKFLLHVASSDPTQGAVTGSAPSTIDCGGFPTAGTVCDELETSGSTVTLNAQPSITGAFQGWEGDCSGTSSTCDVTMSQDRSVTGDFTII